jgi:2-octaprenyl-6-methoxyphenol hydroxylase
MAEHVDIVIAGGGMVGVSLALQLGAVLPDKLSIVLVESFPFPARLEEGALQYHPSFDSRSTALSYSSRFIYEQLGAWKELAERSCAIETIHVSSRGRFGSTLLRAEDYGWSALGYVAENTWLGNSLIQSLYRQGRVEVRSPASVVSAAPSGKGVALRLSVSEETEHEETEIEAALLLVADGANSALREQLGVAVDEKRYGQHAVVANVAFDQPHAGCAYERFTDEGPLALLPLLNGPGSEYRSALVWTLPPDRATQLQAGSDESFMEALQERFGYRMGRVVQVGERQSYPLSLVQSSEQVRQGVVVMGNAAHSLHPVAGQGFNLALRDVAELSAALKAGIAAGKPAGDLATLEKYQQRQQGDQKRTISFSDAVPALFMQTDPVFSLGRDLALAGLDMLPSLKREFVRHATGVAARGEQSSV